MFKYKQHFKCHCFLEHRHPKCSVLAAQISMDACDRDHIAEGS